MQWPSTAGIERTIPKAQQFYLTDRLGCEVEDVWISANEVRFSTTDTLTAGKLAALTSASFVFGGPILAFKGLEAVAEMVEEWGTSYLRRAIEVSYTKAQPAKL